MADEVIAVEERVEEPEEVELTEQEKRIAAGAPEGWLDINEAAEEFDYTPMYMRQLVLQDKVHGEKFDVGSVTKWLIDPESVEAYQNKSITRGGRRKFNLKIDLDEREVVEQALRDAGIDFSLELAYKPKSEGDEEAAEEADEPEAEAEGGTESLF